ncbi:cytochrome c oxidase subunit I [Paracoccus aerius]|uniref:cytochrome-c oxidase n=1 Tax=Paracoccus aerius TaxID=1915382 RepID=A0ABS1S976_9RHOB|nr:cytochrome c oxidase subunit I [Paracoccus aerius]MBL3675089.1 cytochrome c oxidase subunit I [Paracoccus aerius]GHG30874.1 cytochrome c oxidase subunit I [Paracoccus aerius]
MTEDPHAIAPNPPQRALPLHRQMDRIWSDLPGWRGSVASVNHGTIGLRFMATSFLFFSIGGVLAMLIRAQLATRDGAFLDTQLYNQIFTMHGSIMMFLFAIPMLEGLAMWLLPKILGARDMAFPRLGALGYWCYLFGGIIILSSLLFGVAPDGGWFMYVPLSGKTYTPGISADVWLLGVTFVEISAMAAAVEIIVTILRLRAAGMALTRMPLMGWYMLGTAAMMLVGFPPLILGSILLELERAFDWPFFDVLRGGDPMLWQHLFWLFGHPEVYIIFLPAAGVLSTIIPVFARTRILGYGAIVAAIVGLVFLSFGLWVHHMFTVGIPHMALAFFSAASALVAVPTSVQIFAWIGTMWAGRVDLRLPMLHVIGFFATFVMGGLTGVMLAMVPFNWQAHDTHFVVAHLHYVLVGGFVFPMLAGITYWMPMISGRFRVRALGEAAFWLIFLGFHGTFFIMHLTGLLGMPRRVDRYPDNPEWEWLNLVSSIGGMVMSVGFALFVLDIAMQWLFGRRSHRNPWKAQTMDWAMALPAPSYNFASLAGAGRHDASVTLPLARGEGLLPGAPRDRREVLVTEPGTGRPDHVAVLPGNTRLPIWTAAAIGSFFLLMLAGLYWATPLAILLILWAAWQWGGFMGSRRDAEPLAVAPGLALHEHWQMRNTLAYSGTVTLLVADATLYASLLFGVAFLTVIAPNWPPPDSGLGWPVLLTGAAALLMMGLGLVASLLAEAQRAAPPGRLAALAGVAAAGLALLLLAGVAWQFDDPTRHARDALRAALLGYAGFHGVVTLMLALRSLADVRQGRTSAMRRGAAPVWQLFQAFWLGTSALSLGVVALQEIG